MIVINFFGGAGVGKSTLAAEAFASMKKMGLNAELVTEYAKSLTWEGRHIALENQFYVSAKQSHNLWRLQGKVDYVITDAPLIQGLVYKPEELPDEFDMVVNHIFCRYNNINLFVKREVDYIPIGRNQDLKEAIHFDGKIKQIIQRFDHPYWIVSPKDFDITNYLSLYTNIA